jgi:hypothetical protein
MLNACATMATLTKYPDLVNKIASLHLYCFLRRIAKLTCKRQSGVIDFSFIKFKKKRGLKINPGLRAGAKMIL